MYVLAGQCMTLGAVAMQVYAAMQKYMRENQQHYGSSK